MIGGKPPNPGARGEHRKDFEMERIHIDQCELMARNELPAISESMMNEDRLKAKAIETKLLMDALVPTGSAHDFKVGDFVQLAKEHQNPFLRFPLPNERYRVLEITSSGLLRIGDSVSEVIHPSLMVKVPEIVLFVNGEQE